MLQIRIKSVLFFTLALLTLSCTSIEEEVEKQKLTDVPLSYTTAEIISELSKEQEDAFDALNTLQTSTDEMNRLYSTFANITHPCYPADTSFTISRSDLLTAMKQFVTKHCTNLSIGERDKLAATSVLAQEEYTVLYCPDFASNVNYENGLPMTGTWVIPSVLGRRDVTMVW